MKHIISLCSGIGGLDDGVIAALDGDAEVIAFSEFDEKLDFYLQEKYPEAKSLGDLKQIDWDRVGRLLQDPTHPAFTHQSDLIITAGYPCQPFSQAGKRLGEEDPRHLWPEVLRAIRTLQPGLVVLENVRGHLSKGFDTVLGDLAGVGFDAEWSVVSAAEVGAPHRRDRLFVLAFPADTCSAGR